MGNRDKKARGRNVEEIDMARYREEFGLGRESATPSREANPPKNEAALKRALDIRKFEIGLYWQRATYFWAFIAAAFAGFAAVQDVTDDGRRHFLSLLISCIGTLFSSAWYFANRGSKYWQENWENHVDLLEDGVTGPLYKTVVSRPSIWDDIRARTNPWHIIARGLVGPLAYSTSKINQLTSLFIAAFWVLLVVHVTWIDMQRNLDGICIGMLWLTAAGVAAIVLLGRTEGDATHDNLRATLRSARIVKPARPQRSAVTPGHLTLRQSLSQTRRNYFSAESLWTVVITVVLTGSLELLCGLGANVFPDDPMLSKIIWFVKESADLGVLRYFAGITALLVGGGILVRTMAYRWEFGRAISIKAAQYLLGGVMIATGYLIVSLITDAYYTGPYRGFLLLVGAYYLIAFCFYAAARLPIDLEIKRWWEHLALLALGALLVASALPLMHIMRDH